jgi:hypothetical protein
MTTTVHGRSGGFDLTLTLERGDLLPGRLVDGTVRIVSTDGGEIRGARVTLVGTETWRHDVTTSGANGQMHTETKTSTEDLPHVPIQLLGAATFAAGEPREIPFQLPAPSLGPPSFDGTEIRVDWEARLNLDVPGFDPELTLPVVVHQPTALLRAGVIDLGAFALFEDADVSADGIGGTVHLDPVPLVTGAPFHGRLGLEMGAARQLQEVRIELRVEAKSTVSGGRTETIVAWATRLAGEGTFGGGSTTVPFEGALPTRPLPTIRTEHGRADASIHVVLATAWAADPHLVREIAICTTAEL